MKTNIFLSNDSNADNIKKDIEEQDRKNLDFSIVDSYSHEVTITYIYLREKDITNYLKSSVLSYIYHYLHIAIDTNMLVTQSIYYNFNLLESASTKSPELDVRTSIFTDIINI